MRKTIIVGNWKMNADKNFVTHFLKEVLSEMDDINSEVVVCPPYPYLPQIEEMIINSKIQLGAQDCNANTSGPHTGEVSVEMLRDFGVKYVIVGHSERRALYAEDNLIIAKKTKAVLDVGISPILCVGETQEQRDSGNAQLVVGEQIKSVLNMVDINYFAGAIVAYEPVWAIGTGLTPTPEETQEMHLFIRDVLSSYDKRIAKKTSILYGGSMNSNNAKNFISCRDVDGGLIGGASLKAHDFLKICKVG